MKRFNTLLVCLAFVALSGCEQYVYWGSPYGYDGPKGTASKNDSAKGASRTKPPSQGVKTTAGATLSKDGYVVKPGDTLFSIARNHDVELRDIIEENRMKPPFLLRIGDRISIPKARYYTVDEGDTLYAISRSSGADVSRLAKINGLSEGKTIVPGQKLRLPAPAFNVGEGAAEPTAVETAPGVAEKHLTQDITVAELPPDGGPDGEDGVVPSASEPHKAVMTPPPPRSGSRFSWPVRGSVTSPFGPLKGGRHNDGINIGAQRGTSVQAAENGVVVYAGNELQGFGNLILIKHAGGWTSAYAHNDKILVRRGQKVKKGEIISKVGSTGSVSSPQLHFELRKGSRAVDPRKYLS